MVRRTGRAFCFLFLVRFGSLPGLGGGGSEFFLARVDRNTDVSGAHNTSTVSIFFHVDVGEKDIE